MTQRIVILGAGIGGLSVLKELSDPAVDLTDVEITVVDEDFTHFLGFALPWVMRGWRAEDSVPIRTSTEALAGINTVTGSVASIEPESGTVLLADATRIPFDALVIATGARNAVHKVPGLSEAVDDGCAVHYYSADAAAVAHHKLTEFTGGRLVFLVTSQPYRCPVAPYEGALLAADLLVEKQCRAATEIAMYSPEKHPMPSAGPYAGPELVRMLKTNDIEFFGEHSVARVDSANRVIEFADGAVVDFDLLVFVPPHEPAVTLGEPGWITVDPATMQTGYPGIWAVGDTTVIKSPSGQSIPKAATFAKNGAKAAAQSVLNHFGKAERPGELSGVGYCYIDTGEHKSTRGTGDFFNLPHPEIRLSPPSTDLHHSKQEEEQDWRGYWERGARAAV